MDRRRFLLNAAWSVSSAKAQASSLVPVFAPEDFGAKGDGVANDTFAFARMAASLSTQGGGTIRLRKTTYKVGWQSRGRGERTGYSFEPSKILEFVGLSRPLIIRGNGARLRCADGLRYGTFHPLSGQRTQHQMPYLQSGELATPYRAMILVRQCSGSVEISDLELDGNSFEVRIGGQYGDTGWQIPASGLLLQENSGIEKISRIYSHHHAQDGIQIDGLDGNRGPLALSVFDNVTSEYNGRQGVSLVGGRGYSFRNCKFNHTGRGAIASAPGAGVDIEAEAGKKIREATFLYCEFSNNIGPGLVADSGDSEGATFTGCRFVGTTNWSAWPNKPRFRFINCTFVGAIVHAYGDKHPERASVFKNCLYRDDPALSPTGEIYGGENPDRPIADLPGNENVRFETCKFLLTHNSVLPWSIDVTYVDCVLAQSATRESFPRGTYLGKNVIYGRCNLYGSKIVGQVLYNGKPFINSLVPV